MTKQSVSTFWKYVLTGVIFLAVMEFQFSYMIRGNISSFIFAVVIAETGFMIVSFFLGNLLDRLFPRRIVEPVAYIFFGLLGLFVIEWMLVGNSPTGNPDANQFAMFTYYGGAVLLARMFSEKNDHLPSLRKATLYYFIVYSVVSTTVGFILSGNARFMWLILSAIIGYDLMNIFYVWFFWKKWTALEQKGK